MENSILVAGNIIVDLIKRVPWLPEPRCLAPILSIRSALGGLAPNVSLDLARLDPDLTVHIAGCVGSDPEGDYVRTELGQFSNIDQSGIRTGGEPTAFTDVMTVDATGERTFFTYTGANALVGPEDFTFTQDSPRLMHLGYVLLMPGLDAADPQYGTRMARVLAEAQRAGVETSVDVVSEAGERARELVPPALRYADYCTVNEFELETITGIRLRDEDEQLMTEHIAGALGRLRDAGVRRWVTMHAPEGAWGMDAAGVLYEVPSLRLAPEQIRSSVGAGDAFAAGLLLGVLKDLEYAQAMQLGNVAAAMSLGGEGASDGIRPYLEAEEWRRRAYGG
ncbi:MAG: carbohydrate kinase family protein [Clostridia bacterium]|nr:carbohydrate kinase family protein [Clostridia bacterium]